MKQLRVAEKAARSSAKAEEKHNKEVSKRLWQVKLKAQKLTFEVNRAAWNASKEGQVCGHLVFCCHSLPQPYHSMYLVSQS